MTKELKEEIEQYLIDGGYAEQLKDILLIENIELDEDDIILGDDDFLLLEDIEPFEFDELY